MFVWPEGLSSPLPTGYDWHCDALDSQLVLIVIVMGLGQRLDLVHDPVRPTSNVDLGPEPFHYSILFRVFKQNPSCLGQYLAG